MFHSEVNTLNCVVSPEGGGIGYVASVCNSVEEAVVLAENKISKRKKQHP